MSVLFVVPTLGDRPAYLRQALDSITSQGVDLDLVLVAPPGKGVEQLAEEYAGRFVQDPRAGGISGALNAGLAAGGAGTAYFTWLGDDDLLTPGSLAATTALLDARPDAVMAYGHCDYVDDEGTVVFRSAAGRLAGLIVGWAPNLVPQPGCLFRYDDVVAVGGLDASVRLAMDLDLFLRLRRRGRIVALPRTVACFRWHAGSATVQGGGESMEESDRVRMRYMRPATARAYSVLRWPGRWALWAAKRRVDHNSRRVARGR